jgi:hypothetical protein
MLSAEPTIALTIDRRLQSVREADLRGTPATAFVGVFDIPHAGHG